MERRRDYLNKIGLLAPLSLGVFVTKSCSQGGGQPYPLNVIYTKNSQGQWQGKAGTHVPFITKNSDGSLVIETKHGMSEEHFIVSHKLVGMDGQVLYQNVFSPKDKPVSEVAKGLTAGNGKVLALSLCNKHDLWLTEFSL